MSDQITGFIRYNDVSGNALRYEVTFSFDGVDVPADQCVINIAGPIMIAPDDATEAKTKAMFLASQVKALYASPVTVDDMVGPVTL